jgi:hypothetical protein
MEVTVVIRGTTKQQLLLVVYLIISFRYCLNSYFVILVGLFHSILTKMCLGIVDNCADKVYNVTQSLRRLPLTLFFTNFSQKVPIDEH